MGGRRRNVTGVGNRGNEGQVKLDGCPCNDKSTKNIYLDNQNSKKCNVCGVRPLMHIKCAEKYVYKTLRENDFNHVDFFDKKKTPYYCPSCNDSNFTCPCVNKHSAFDFSTFIAYCHHEYEGRNGHWLVLCRKKNEKIKCITYNYI